MRTDRVARIPKFADDITLSYTLAGSNTNGAWPQVRGEAPVPAVFAALAQSFRVILPALSSAPECSAG